MNNTSFTHTYFLCAHGLADIGQVALSAMPVKAIPVKQDIFQVRLSAGKINGAFGLPFQTADARFEFGHNIEHTFQIAFSILKALQGIIAAGTIQPNAGRLFEQTTTVISLQSEGRIHQPLTKNGISPLA